MSGAGEAAAGGGGAAGPAGGAPSDAGAAGAGGAGPSVRRIHVEELTRVEGEGGLDLVVEGGKVTAAGLRIFEPPRLFEALLRGRPAAEAPDVTARICGICPVAYQMSAVAAIEAAAGVEVPHGVRALRRLLYCGEWIESHALHVYMLHAPDFLGFESAVEMAREHRARVEAGLALKKAGNEVVRVIGGREIHPVNVRAGGFYRTPSRRELQALVPGLERARDLARETVRWVAGFEFPAIERDWTFVALRNPREYPMSVGRIAASDGLDIPPAEFFEHFEEEHLPHSNALHSRRKGGGPYQTGPLARYALNRERLSPGALEAAKEVGLEPVVRNPYRSIIVRALETLHAVEEALRTIAGFEPPDPPAVPIPARAGTGIGATEAPRGLLVHRYAIDWRGVLTDARIVPPTSQNQASIEADLRAIAERFLDLDDEALRHRCEQAIRSYDPCISCATHFLKLRVERR